MTMDILRQTHDIRMTEKHLIKEKEAKAKSDFFLQEEKAQGSLSSETIKRTLKASGGYIWNLLTYLIVPFGVMYGLRKMKEDASSWGNGYSDGVKKDDLMYRVLIWTAYIALLGFFKRLFVFISIVWMGREMHAKMVFRILHCKINEFMKRIPAGQIINRFSNDIDIIDKEIGDNAYNLNYLIPKNVLNVYSIAIGADNPYMIIPLTACVFVSLFMRSLYMNGKREVVRLFQITRSPVIGLGTSCVLGGSVIRRLGNQGYLQAKLEKMVDENSKNRLMDIGLDAWFSVNMAMIDFFVV